jgi:dihydroorotase
VRRDIAIALGSGAAVHIAHVSTAETIRLVRAAKRNGARLTCEVTPHHFTLDDTAVLESGTNARMAPPLRSREDVEVLRAAMADGTIDMIASDHAPHDPISKRIDRLGQFFGHAGATQRLSAEDAEIFANAANGVIGLETSLGLGLGLVHQRIMDAPRLVEMMSTSPAGLLRFEDAGTLAVGARADVTIIDPNREWTVEAANFFSKSRNTPFNGMKLTGKALMTIVSGEIVYDARGRTSNV